MTAKFIAVGGDASSVKFATSPDGNTWTSHGNGGVVPFNTDVLNVAWSPDLELLVATGDGTIWSSPDGITWTQRLGATGGTSDGVAWSAPLGLFAVVDRQRNVWTSPDGITWTQQVVGNVTVLNDICWGDDKFVAVGNLGTNLKAYTSPDGTTWTNRGATTSSSGQGVTYSPDLDLYVMVMNSGSSNVFTSPDGVTWTNRGNGGQAGQNGTDVAWSPDLGLFVLTAAGGTAISTSPDGITWTARTSGVAGLGAVTWCPDIGLFAAAGGTTIVTSPDGITWTSQTNPFTTAIKDVTWFDVSTGLGLVVGFMSLR